MWMSRRQRCFLVWGDQSAAVAGNVEVVVGGQQKDVFAPVNTVATDKRGGGRRKLDKDKVGCLKDNMRENVTVIDLNLYHRYVPKTLRQTHKAGPAGWATTLCHKGTGCNRFDGKINAPPKKRNPTTTIKTLFFSFQSPPPPLHFLYSQRCQRTTTRRPVWSRSFQPSPRSWAPPRSVCWALWAR